MGAEWYTVGRGEGGWDAKEVDKRGPTRGHYREGVAVWPSALQVPVCGGKHVP